MIPATGSGRVGVIGSFGGSELSLTMRFGRYACVLFAGARLVARRRMQAVGNTVGTPGRWAPMLLAMGCHAAKFAPGFAAGFATGIATGMGSPWLRSARFVLPMGTVLGVRGGGFGARAPAVSRFARSPPPSPGRALA